MRRPVPPPKVVPLPTSGGGTARTGPSDVAFVPYHGALTTLSIRARGIARLVGPAVRWCAFGARGQCVLARSDGLGRGATREPPACRSSPRVRLLMRDRWARCRASASSVTDAQKQEIVQDRGELPDHHYREARHRDREHDRPVDAEDARAVDLPRLDELTGDGGVVVSENQRRDRNPVHDVDKDQAGNGTIEPDAAQHLDERDQDALVGDEHPEEEQGKQAV